MVAPATSPRARVSRSRSEVRESNPPAALCESVVVTRRAHLRPPRRESNAVQRPSEGRVGFRPNGEKQRARAESHRATLGCNQRRPLGLGLSQVSCAVRAVGPPSAGPRSEWRDSHPRCMAWKASRPLQSFTRDTHHWWTPAGVAPASTVCGTALRPHARARGRSARNRTWIRSFGGSVAPSAPTCQRGVGESNPLSSGRQPDCDSQSHHAA